MTFFFVVCLYGIDSEWNKPKLCGQSTEIKHNKLLCGMSQIRLKFIQFQFLAIEQTWNKNEKRKKNWKDKCKKSIYGRNIEGKEEEPICERNWRKISKANLWNEITGKIEETASER